LLCHKCNVAEGYLDSDVEKMRGLVEYLLDASDKNKKYDGMVWYN